MTKELIEELDRLYETGVNEAGERYIKVLGDKGPYPLKDIRILEMYQLIKQQEEALAKIVEREMSPPLLARDDGTTVELSVYKLLEENTQLKEEISRKDEALEELIEYAYDKKERDWNNPLSIVDNCAHLAEQALKPKGEG